MPNVREKNLTRCSCFLIASSLLPSLAGLCEEVDQDLKRLGRLPLLPLLLRHCRPKFRKVVSVVLSHNALFERYRGESASPSHVRITTTAAYRYSL